MKKKKVIIISMVIVILIVLAVVLVIKLKPAKKEVRKKTITRKTEQVVIDQDKYKHLTKVRTTSVEDSNYKVSIIDGELIISFDGKGAKVNGINEDIIYVTDLGNFVSYEPTFVAIAKDSVYVGEMSSNGEVNFDKINTKNSINEVYLVNELDYSFGYVKQAYAYLDNGELRKIEYNAYSNKATLARTYENRFVDLFLWGNGGLVLRIDKGKNDLLLAKSQVEEYDENHQMVVKLDFEEMLYNKKKVNVKYVILSDEGYKAYVVTKENEVLYAEQDKDIANQNVLELKEYSNKKVKDVKVLENKALKIIYEDDSSKELNYDVLYEGSKE